MIRALILIFSLSVCACGPKEIGEGSSFVGTDPPEASGAEMLRLPMSGANNTQKFLYWVNHPTVMQNVQNWQREKYLRSMGLKPNPEDPAYREVPKQRSPFRQ